VREVAGSNPAAPTIFHLLHSKLFLTVCRDRSSPAEYFACCCVLGCVVEAGVLRIVALIWRQNFFKKRDDKT
jgi:hypothetical protein